MALINYVHRIFHEYSVIYYQDTKRFYFLKIQNKKIKYADIYQKKKKKFVTMILATHMAHGKKRA